MSRPHPVPAGFAMPGKPRACSIQRRRPAAGFTLVELLVVVTIIVVLLALLLPAMGKAIYQATLVSCAGQLKTTTTGLHTYTGDFKRFYPDRQLKQLDNMIPMALATGVVQAPESAGWDTRPALKGYVLINKQLNDPFVEPVDLEYIEDPPDTLIYASYAIYYGWHYRHPSGGAPMTKLGDTWEWQRRQYRILIADYELLWTAPQDNITASHPDTYGGRHIMTPNRGQNVFAPSHAQNVTTSVWRAFGTFDRADLDMNYAHEDGSVLSLRQLKVVDERYDLVPYYLNAQQTATFRMYVPRP